MTKHINKTIDSTTIYSTLNEKYPLEEYCSNPIGFIEYLQKEQNDIVLKSYQHLLIEVRAIVPDRVRAFIEYEGYKNFVIFYNPETFDLDNEEMQDDELAKNSETCLWMAIFHYLLLKNTPYVIDMVAPYTLTQMKSMFPFIDQSDLTEQEKHDMEPHFNILYKLTTYLASNR